MTNPTQKRKYGYFEIALLAAVITIGLIILGSAISDHWGPQDAEAPVSADTLTPN